MAFINALFIKFKAFIRKPLEKKTVFYMTMVIWILLLTLAYLGYQGYRDNKQSLILQQQQQMLTISRSTARSLEYFVAEKLESLKILALNHDFRIHLETFDPAVLRQYLQAYVTAQSEDIRRVYLTDRTGEVIYQYPGTLDTLEVIQNKALLQEDILKTLQTQKSWISRAKKDADGRFIINILDPVRVNGGLAGLLISTIGLDMVERKLVRPIKSGEKGYVMIKDADGIILMHPSPDQLGINVLDTRKQIHPDFDFRELEELIKQQYSSEEGTRIYHSYWWPDHVLERTKKLNAFSRAKIGDSFWVVAVTMSYNEIEQPIRQSLIWLMEISATIVLILTSVVFIVLKMQKNKEALEVETRYLKELNQATEELRQKDLQLQHSQKLQAVGTLAGGIAHEFNNLLTPILGYAEIIRNQSQRGSIVRDYVTEIYEASLKAKDIVEQILVFSRWDGGRSKYQPIAIGPLVEETLNLVKSTVNPNIRVGYKMNGGCGYILGNRAQIHQAVFNLCLNACHAMKPAGGVLKVDLAVVTPEEMTGCPNVSQAPEIETYIRLQISDNGSGMSQETLARIFEPFFTTKPEGEGTGLGLFIVHKTIENHHGFITVHSEPGKGSCFEIYLPQIATQGPESVDEFNFQMDRENKAVLLVDDQPKVLRLLKKSLEQYGFKVTAETNSVEALKRFSANPGEFDIVITDEVQPYLKGHELAERLKVIRPSIKVILITGFAQDSLLEVKERLMIDEYLLKPVSGEVIVRTIRKVLKE